MGTKPGNATGADGTTATPWNPDAVAELLDLLPDVVFFAKDRAGRYLAVNRTLLARLRLADRDEAIGRTARDLFPAPLGERYLAQDERVCATGEPLTGLLELHLYPDGSEGWCVTDKLPVRDAAGRVVGLVGTSRDVHPTGAGRESLTELAGVIDHVRSNLERPLRVGHLAAMAGLSPFRLNRRFQALFGITVAQFVAAARIEAATRLLREGDTPVAGIAAACGYCDQSAFARQFKAIVGLTPRQYRQRFAATPAAG